MLILIKPSIVKGVTVLNSTCSDIQWLKLSGNYFHCDKDIFLCFVYAAPSNSSYVKRHRLDILQELETDVIRYKSLGSILIFGDTNARIGVENDFVDTSQDSKYLPVPDDCGNCYVPTNKRNSQDTLCCQRGKELLELCISSNLQILNGKVFGDHIGRYTSYQYNGNSVVDYCIASETILSQVIYFNVDKPIPYLSDHSKITLLLRVRCKPILCSNSCNNSKTILKQTCYIWKSENIPAFQEACASTDVTTRITEFSSQPILENGKNVDDVVENFKSIVYLACSKSLRVKKRFKNQKKQKKWFDQDLGLMRKELMHKSQRYANNPTDVNIRNSFYKYRKLYGKCCKKKRQDFMKSIFSKLDNMYDKDPESYWKLIKDLEDDIDKPDMSSRIPGEKWVTHFSKLFSIKSDFVRQNEYYSSLLNNIDSEHCNISSLNVPITDKEIAFAVKGLKNNKSAGPDGIKNEMLKYGLTYLLPCLNKLFNMLLSKGCYPSDWKVGILKPIFKSGDPDDPSNYRGISLTSCVAKLFNSILNNRLQSYLDEHGIIHNVQIGFQPKARTSDHMFVLRTIIEKFISCRSKLFTCFVDFSRAFDTILHSTLIVKMNKIGINGHFLSVLNDMYSNNFIHVKLKSREAEKVSDKINCSLSSNNVDEYTDKIAQNVGVRQGDNLSPNLFKIFVNDLPEQFTNEHDPISLGNLKISCLLYADDLILLSTSKKGLQLCLDTLSDYCTRNCLSVNLKKTQVLVFGKGKVSPVSFYYRTHLLEQVSSYKYLGIVFSSNGSFYSLPRRSV